jgi:hypothetical protein
MDDCRWLRYPIFFFLEPISVDALPPLSIHLGASFSNGLFSFHHLRPNPSRALNRPEISNVNSDVDFPLYPYLPQRLYNAPEQQHAFIRAKAPTLGAAA